MSRGCIRAATAVVRDLIKLRYRLMPYLYDLSWQHHTAFEPITRPTLYEFPDDPACWMENDELMLGPSLLTAPVVERGATAARNSTYPPARRGVGPLDRRAGSTGGQCGDPSRYPCGSPGAVWFAKAPAIPLNIAEQHFDQRADERRVCGVSAGLRGGWRGICFEDDGESVGDGHGF